MGKRGPFLIPSGVTGCRRSATRAWCQSMTAVPTRRSSCAAGRADALTTAAQLTAKAAAGLIAQRKF